METYDKIIIGAGLYGLYSALFCAEMGQRVLVLEYDNAPFKRATHINQARVHQGYHYPRSLSTAVKSAGYFERFSRDYAFCINSEFDQIYATSSTYSWTDGSQFKDFCSAAGIPCEEVHPGSYFRDGMCDGAFRTREYTYDAKLLRDYFVDRLEDHSSCVEIKYDVRIADVECHSDVYVIRCNGDMEYASDYVLNATYAGVNQVLKTVGFTGLPIKYELCEIILCDVGDRLKNVGITVMDGPFFSIMPFGMTGFHSLTAVTFTPHSTSYDEVPVFSCQERSRGYCSSTLLGNCNDCKVKPETSFPYMSNLAHKYLKDEYDFRYNKSLYSIKPILMSSEIDDSRPTVIKEFSSNPTFVTVLSGKINTVYDLDEVLSYDK